MSVYVAFSVIEDRAIPRFFTGVILAFRLLTLACGRLSSSVFLSLSTACVVVDSACAIMVAFPWNIFPLAFLDWIGSCVECRCPFCYLDLEGSWIFALALSYMILFVLPFRNGALVLVPCFLAYVSSLSYFRWLNYLPYDGVAGDRSGSSGAQEVGHFTMYEILLLTVTVSFNVVAKGLMESGEFGLWSSMTESRKIALDEKILRCKAEYASEHVKTSIFGNLGWRQDVAPSVLESATSGRDNPSAPMSMASAPPILGRDRLTSDDEKLLASQCDSPSGSDCLQETDIVWTSEIPHPIPVKDLVKGQHVLCYDHLSKGLKHTEVLNVVSQEDVVQWANIVLKDGTSIRVTADHPFLTSACGKSPSSLLGSHHSPCHARDLKPLDDKVLVMKLVPVEVKSVTLDALEALKAQVRVAVEIQQPLRHSIFVSRSDTAVPEYPIAVGAANLDVMGEYVLRADKTFLDFLEFKPTIRRTNSSPGCLETIEWECPHVGPLPESSKSGSGQSMSSISSDVTPLSDNESRIRIGAGMRPEKVAGGQVITIATCEGKVGLQDFLQLQRSGMPSIGSLCHHEGRCATACWFENQRQHGRLKKCSVGIMCERCHFDHPFVKRKRHA